MTGGTTSSRPGSRIPDLEQAFSTLSDALAADGYELRIESSGDQSVRLVIGAGSAACPECLIPKAMFEEIAAQRLPNHGRGWRLEIIYPEPPGLSEASRDGA